MSEPLRTFKVVYKTPEGYSDAELVDAVSLEVYNGNLTLVRSYIKDRGELWEAWKTWAAGVWLSYECLGSKKEK